MGKRDNVVLADIEVYPNFFMLGIKGFNNKITTIFEISEERNDIKELIEFLIEFKGYLITFNGIYYDTVVLKHIRDNYKMLSTLTAQEACWMIKQFNNKVIDSDENFDSIKIYKWAKQSWTNIDLFLYWSKMIRISKHIGLKSLGIQLGYPVVQELPYHHEKHFYYFRLLKWNKALLQ